MFESQYEEHLARRRRDALDLEYGAVRYAVRPEAPDEWTEFTVTGPVDVVRYRTNADASVVQFWSDHLVPGLARRGWNTTRSESVALRARRFLRGESP
jgi:hypothetical protein